MSTIKPFNPFRSERLVYRAVEDTPEDEAFVHAIQHDAEAQSGSSYGLLRPESVKKSNEFKEHIERCLLGAIVCLAPTNEREHAGEPVGILCLKANPPSWAPHRWTDISIDVLKKHQGKGYGGEAIEWSLWWAFQMAGLHRVQIQAFGFNTGAMRLYSRLGFKEEGRMRDHIWFAGSWHDGVIYGILEDEWRDEQRKAGRDLTSSTREKTLARA
ncbi:putative GNAT family acetyltransferase [Nemania serpens]|nr:putative GNAT family acetyltransferase [Nemania serpens]